MRTDPVKAQVDDVSMQGNTCACGAQTQKFLHVLLDTKLALQTSGCGSAIVVTYTICLFTVRSLTDGVHV